MNTLTQRLSLFLLTLFFVLAMTSCDAIGDIFGAGVWTGVILVIAIIAVAIWLISRLFGGGRRNP